MGCRPSKKEVTSGIQQTAKSTSCLQPPQIDNDNDTEFYSSHSSTEVPNSEIPDLPMESQDIAAVVRRKARPI